MGCVLAGGSPKVNGECPLERRKSFPEGSLTKESFIENIFAVTVFEILVFCGTKIALVEFGKFLGKVLMIKCFPVLIPCTHNL